MEAKQFGNYTLMERISHGGMAEVFRAKSFGEAGFEREVALKVLLPQIASDSEFITMLIDEAKIAGQLNHTNIAQIFDLGVTDGRYYIVQEYVRGQDLRALLKHKAATRTHFEIATACHIASKVCEGLYYAHNKKDGLGNPLKVVHRDISPHNILVSAEGEVKIIDFGIAKAEGRSTQTLAGLVKGKFAYMSPEQIRGLPVDHRSDVFATGILLYEMLTSRSLFRRSTEFETLKQARSAKANPPSTLRAEIPPALDAIVLKALARHVHDRYQSADELRNALWTFAREHDAYRRGGLLSEINQDRAETADSQDMSIQVELASEVSAVDEMLIESSSPIEETPPDREAFDIEHDFENSTIVDPGIPFPIPDIEPTDNDDILRDQDAQWAANVGGPLHANARSESALARIPRGSGNETDVGTNVETDEYGQNDVNSFEEQTSVPPTTSPTLPNAKMVQIPTIPSLASNSDLTAQPQQSKPISESGSVQLPPYQPSRAATGPAAPLPRPRSNSGLANLSDSAPGTSRASTTPFPASLPVASPMPTSPEHHLESGSHSGPLPLPGSSPNLAPSPNLVPQVEPTPAPNFTPQASSPPPGTFPPSPDSQNANAAPVMATPTEKKAANSARLPLLLAALLFLLLSSAASISLLFG